MQVIGHKVTGMQDDKSRQLMYNPRIVGHKIVLCMIFIQNDQMFAAIATKTKTKMGN